MKRVSPDNPLSTLQVQIESLQYLKQYDKMENVKIKYRLVFVETDRHNDEYIVATKDHLFDDYGRHYPENKLFDSPEKGIKWLFENQKMWKEQNHPEYHEWRHDTVSFIPVYTLNYPE